LINQILKQTLSVLTQIPIRFDLRSRVKRQLLYFDEISGCAVNGTVFNQVVLNRKSDRYREALDIAKLILLNYHPDISKGATHVLALMFDMNKLWEGFITSMMKKYLSDNFKVKSQNSKIFWYSERGRKRLKPDILLIPKQDSSEPLIIDTKWKAPSRLRPSDTDLRQIFAYNQLFNSKRGMLLYPGSRNSTIGTFKTEEGGTCGMHFVDVLDEVGNLLTDKSMLKQILQT
jgi:5-methylcytosine-specific restriction enzyme subunit McrC